MESVSKSKVGGQIVNTDIHNPRSRLIGNGIGPLSCIVDAHVGIGDISTTIQAHQIHISIDSFRSEVWSQSQPKSDCTFSASSDLSRYSMGGLNPFQIVIHKLLPRAPYILEQSLRISNRALEPDF
jgi:hypothetical protein